ncbi:hypothetical protein C455_13827 [Haloferax larsenii JCM 13917]|nr:DUF6498-containing protein [Haloferax larsenii]ELZ76873.1 hypothetical protein C455_13827 [Haloferax larsenii JCM 13917]
MRLPSPHDSGALAVLASNAVAPVGVLLLGWSLSVLFGVFVAEVAAVLFWTCVKIPFAAKRPNNAMDEDNRLLGPLQEKRGSLSIPGPFPPFYPRNVPVLLVTVFLLAPLELITAFMVFGLIDPVVTEATAGRILLGGLGVFVGRGVETGAQYFVKEGYRDHSARSVLLSPFKLLVAIAVLLAVAGPLLGSVESGVLAVTVVAAGKLLYDLRTLQVERDDDKRGAFYRLYGSEETEIEPVPVAVPEGEPAHHVRLGRVSAIADAGYRSVRYTLSSGVLWCYAVAVAMAVFGAESWALACLALAGVFAAVRGTTRYLTYGTVEYRCYDDVLVVYDEVLDEPQARLERDAITDVTVSSDIVDRLFGTETVEFDTDLETGPDVQLTVPEPEEVNEDDANANHPQVVPHVDDAQTIIEALGVGRRRLLTSSGDD